MKRVEAKEASENGANLPKLLSLSRVSGGIFSSEVEPYGLTRSN